MSARRSGARFPLTLERAVPAAGRQAAPAKPGAQTAATRLAPNAAPPAAAAGVGLDSAAVRLNMVARLRASGEFDEAVLQAMATVPRHRFVESALVGQAYEDTSLPIGLGQTISKPSVVARMLSLLLARPGGPGLRSALEIGTGCGYQAAVLSLLARNVFSIERLRPLYDQARENLADLRPSHLRLIYGDGRLGHAPNAPYDGIVSAAGGEQIPAAWLEQLAPGGRLVAPMHDDAGGSQVLVVVDRDMEGRYVHRRHEAVRFVPLESGLD